jgi:hypothetical protein
VFGIFGTRYAVNILVIYFCYKFDISELKLLIGYRCHTASMLLLYILHKKFIIYITEDGGSNFFRNDWPDYTASESYLFVPDELLGYAAV